MTTIKVIEFKITSRIGTCYRYAEEGTQSHFIGVFQKGDTVRTAKDHWHHPNREEIAAAVHHCRGLQNGKYDVVFTEKEVSLP